MAEVIRSKPAESVFPNAATCRTEGEQVERGDAWRLPWANSNCIAFTLHEHMLYLGLDAGGTKTKLLGRAGGDTFSLDGAGANLQRVGLNAAATILASMVREALQMRPQEEQVAICAGVSGAGRSSQQSQLAERIQSIVETADPARAVHIMVVHDAHIALEGAFHGESGIIVIAGTGSVGFARTPDGRLHRVGGWGYLLGDEGSGYVIGVRGVAAACAMHDGGPKTKLAEIAREEFGIASVDDAIEKVYRQGWQSQKMAPLVVRAAREGDAVASSILHEQANLLADQAVWLQRRCPDVEHQIALIGGLAGVDFYQEILSDALRKRLKGWQIRRDVDPPVVGALRLAEKAAT